MKNCAKVGRSLRGCFDTLKGVKHYKTRGFFNFSTRPRAEAQGRKGGRGEGINLPPNKGSGTPRVGGFRYPLDTFIYPLDTFRHPLDIFIYSLDTVRHPLDTVTHPLDTFTYPLDTFY